MDVLLMLSGCYIDERGILDICLKYSLFLEM